jgi:Protein of unknown function (DUF3617)
LREQRELASHFCEYYLAMKPITLPRQTILFGALNGLVLLFFALSVAEAADRIANGKWESAMTTDGETKTVTYCISPAEAASINGDSRTGRDFAEKKAEKAGSRCTIKSYDLKGDTGSYILNCGSRTITDTTNYHGDTSEGVKTVTNEGVTIKTSLKSRRVGPCP